MGLIKLGIPADNYPPKIESADFAAATEDIYFKYVGAASDPGDAVFSWSFDHFPGWLSADADSVFGTPLEGDGDTSFTVIVSDGDLEDTVTVQVAVLSVNDPPVITSPALVFATEDLQFGYQATATDPEDSTMTFAFDRLPAWLAANADSAFGTPLEGAVDTSLRAIASDGSLTDTLIVSITVSPVNDPPQITSLATALATEDMYFKYVATATDPEDSTMTFAFDRLPAWLAANADSAFGTPLEGAVDTSFRVIASDGQLRDTLVVALTVTLVNEPPQITSLATALATEDMYFKYVASAIDPEDSTMTFAFDRLPAWLTANADSTFGTPLEGALDTIFRVIASDGQLRDTLVVALTVTPVNDKPNNFSLLLPSDNSEILITPVTQDLNLTFRWSESDDPDGDSLTYAFVGSDTLEQIIRFGPAASTEQDVSMSEIAGIMISMGLGSVSAAWTIGVMDGKADMVFAVNGPFQITIDISALLQLSDKPDLPQQFALHQNYPNPFNPTSTIKFDIPEATTGYLLVYDILGRELTRLIEGEIQAGYHQTVWNGKDISGSEVSTGIYIARLVTPEYSKSIKLVLLK